jgi:hypothetical protein
MSTGPTGLDDSNEIDAEVRNGVLTGETARNFHTAHYQTASGYSRRILWGEFCEREDELPGQAAEGQEAITLIKRLGLVVLGVHYEGEHRHV